MKRPLALLNVLSSLSLCSVPAVLYAGDAQIKVVQVLQSTQAWDGSQYASYPAGQPKVTVLRITIPPNTTLPWHHHPTINVGCVLSGHLMVEKRDTGERRILHAGKALAETVQTTHHGSQPMNQSS